MYTLGTNAAVKEVGTAFSAGTRDGSVGQASYSQPHPQALGIALTVAQGTAKDQFGGR